MRLSFDDIVRSFEKQAVFCRECDALATSVLCEAAGEAIRTGGPLAWLVKHYGENPWKSALPLRIAGAIRRLAVLGRAPVFAAHDASSVAAGDLIAPLNELVEKEETHFREYIARPPQTNEVRRTAALLPGIAAIAEATGLPLDLYELGASGGLLLGFDRFRYEYGAYSWGGEGPLIQSEWRGDPPSWPDKIAVTGRFGCDWNPVDFSDPEQLAMMCSYIWPEQPHRRALFDDAVEATRLLDIKLDAADALDWAEGKTKARRSGAAQVFFHSVFATYLDNVGVARLERIMKAAGVRATKEAPFAWLRFEPVDTGESFAFFLDLSLWPHNIHRRIATAHAHGQWVEPIAN